MTPEPPAGSNAAWTVIDSALSPQAMVEFCRDLERLYRINPCLEFKHWRALGGGRYRAEFRNLINRRDYVKEFTVEQCSVDEFQVCYDQGIKTRTRFHVQSAPAGSTLTVTDEYADIDADGPDVDEIDRSLNA